MSLHLAQAVIAGCVEHILIICCHVRLNMKSASLLEFPGCSCISIASFKIWFMYVAILFSLCFFFSNWISCPVFNRCSTTSDFSAWLWHRCYVFFTLNFNSPGCVARINLAYFTWNAVHPRCFQAQIVLIGLKVWTFFHSVVGSLNFMSSQQSWLFCWM